MNLRHLAYETYKNISGTLAGPKTVSDFEKTGKLTPQEFVDSGDELIDKVPCWGWVGAATSASDGNTNNNNNNNSVQSYLPVNKKGLVYRNVRCRRQWDDNEGVEGEVEDKDEDGFVSLGNRKDKNKSNPNKQQTEDKRRGESENEDARKKVKKSQKPAVKKMNFSSSSSSEDEEEEEEKEEGEDETNKKENDAHAISSSSSSASDDDDDINAFDNSDRNSIYIPNRVYDVYILYDKAEQTPRIYLIGYKLDNNNNNNNNNAKQSHLKLSNRVPLTAEEMEKEIMTTKINKTVTIDANNQNFFLKNFTLVQPHRSHSLLLGGLPAISIHPCRHAAAMVNIINRLRAEFEHEKAERKKQITNNNNQNQKQTENESEEDEEFHFPACNSLKLFIKMIAPAVPFVEMDVSDFELIY